MIELNVLSGDVVDLNVNDNSPTALEVNMATSGGGGGQLSDDVKQALLQIAENVAYINDQGQVYYDDLYNALYPLVSIQAVYTQSGTVYDTDSLDSLKSDLVVTAVHNGGTTETVTTYTLSGTLVEGTSTITVSYGGKTTTFNVTVTHQAGTVTITNTLSGCTNSNSDSFATEGDSYSATITASSGYTMVGASVVITMGGVDITSTAYSNGTISIASLTDNLSITITAVLIELVSISAVYTQSGTVYDTDSLDILKSDLVVTALYSDATTATVTAYILSGTLTEGSSTIYVVYGGKTTTFNVTVTETPRVLDNGTHTFADGSSVTVLNDHVTIVLGTKNGQKFVNLSSLSNNTTDIGSTNNINNQTTEFLSISNGETVTASIFNASSDNANWKSASDSSVDVSMNLRKKSATTSILSPAVTVYPKEYTDGLVHHDVKTNSTETWTASDNVIAGCLLVFIGSNFPSGTTIEFDVALSVE